MTHCRRRTRRHPDKWKQRARMRALVRELNTTYLPSSFYEIDHATLEEYLQGWGVAMRAIGEGFALLEGTVMKAALEVETAFGPLLERLKA